MSPVVWPMRVGSLRELFVGTLVQVPTFPANGHSVWPPEVIPHEEPHDSGALRLFACEIGEDRIERERVCCRLNIWMARHVWSENRIVCMRCGFRPQG